MNRGVLRSVWVWVVCAGLVPATVLGQTPRAPTAAGTVTVTSAPIVRVSATDNLQDKINAATVPGTTLLLAAGVEYRQSVIFPKTNPGIRLTTEGCGPYADGPAQTSERSRMATIRPVQTQSYALWIMAGRIKVDCLAIVPGGGSGELIRVGDATSTILADTPDGDVIQHNLLLADWRTQPQKRGIAANGSHLLIVGNTIDGIRTVGQDTQCIAVFSTPGPITILHNYLRCASENVIIGGVPPAGPAFLPSDVLTEWNVLDKDLAWAETASQVKNLYEVKIGRRIMARHNWMQNHWVDAQPGWAIVLTMATNGACSWCVMEDIGFEENVVWNVVAGVNMTGYQYSFAPGAGAGVGYSIRGNLFKIAKSAIVGPGGKTGGGRFVQVMNEPKNGIIDHNTVIYDGAALVTADYGTKWPFQDPPLTGSIKAGPFLGFQFTNNVGLHSSYGIITPEGNSGINLGTYFPGAIVGGNVFAGAGGTTLGRYNLFAGTAGPNVGVPVADFPALFTDYANGDYCLKTPGAGADCSKLPFELRALVPR